MAVKEKKPAGKEEKSSQSEIVRRFKANPMIFIGTIVILVIVIVAFVLVPAFVPNAGGRTADLSFGSYNKIPISYVPGGYFANVQGSIARSRQAEVQETNYQLVSYQIWRQAFEETVVHTGILDELKTAKYAVPPEIVDREVALLPQFQENGRFSAALYQQLDSASRLSLWKQVRESIAEERYRGDITGLRVPSGETAFIAAMASPQRSFDMAAFSIDNYPEAEIRAYAMQNPDLFRVTHLSKISINSSEREARQILASVKDGTATFEDSARTHSQDSYAEKGGDMSVKLAYELTTEVSAAADRDILAKLARGEISDIIKTTEGWAFFRAEEVPRLADVGDDITYQKIRSYVTEYERGRMEDWALDNANAFIAQVQNSSFDEALEEQGLTKQNFGPLPLNYGGVELFSSLDTYSQSIGELAGGSTDENFWETAFSTPIKTLSPPIVLGRNILVLYPLEESGADSTTTEYIESYATYWQSYITNQSIRSFFLTNDKLEDRFFNTFIRYFWSES
jgi:hypothetical protein